MESPARLWLLIGIPGVGKTAVANLLQPHLPPRWTMLRGDDFIGIAQAIYPGRPWEEVWRFSRFFVGWSTGWFLAGGRGVLLEGHFRDAEELDRLMLGVREFCPTCARPTIVQLDGDRESIVRRLAENPARAPDWKGEARVPNLRAWLERNRIDPAVPASKVWVEGVSTDEVARKVAEIFGLDWESGR